MRDMRTFKPYDPDQAYLLPPDLRAWVPEGHLALFISDVVDALDLSPILSDYERGDGRGQPPYHPVMMVKLLVYAYCMGKTSSRKIEKATWEEVAYRVLAANQNPDHDSISEFRKRHLSALAGLFVQVLLLCQEAGLVKLGHVAIDGSKAKAKAQAQAEEARERIAQRERQETETGKKIGGTPPRIPDPEEARPDPKAQKNFTDEESRIMLDGATKSFTQAYNAQVAVDSASQIIVATAVTQDANDKKQLTPLLEGVVANLGRLPENTSADNGYFSEEVVNNPQIAGTNLHVPPAREKAAEAIERHSASSSPVTGVAANATSSDSIGKDSDTIPSAAEQMREKLRTPMGHAIYKMRKAIVEPVFGQIKQVRGFRQFSFRGLAKVTAEWDLISLTHNLLKLFRSGWQRVNSVKPRGNVEERRGGEAGIAVPQPDQPGIVACLA